MSYSNVLETNARYAVAVSVLNNFRQWLMGRENVRLLDENLEIFRESIDINQSPQLSGKMILYSFQGLGNDEHSAALNLSDALTKALTFIDDNEKEYFLNTLKRILEEKNANLVEPQDKERLLELVLNAMEIINGQTQRGAENLFAKKDL